MSDSPTIQRYTAEVYRLQQEAEFATIAGLAEHIDVSLQAATRMARRLKEKGLIHHEPYRGVRLTEQGERVAMRGIRRHRLTELFLVQVMGFGWDEVHDVTHRFERGVDDVVEDRIDEMLGHPTRCPHGEPIPTRDGQMPQLNDMPLTSLTQGTAARVSRVRVHDPEKLRYLGKLGLKPGAEIHFLTCAPFEGPVRVMVGKVDQVIGYSLAAALWVEPLE